MEHANVWTGSQRKSTTRKPSSGGSASSGIPSNDPQGFLRKFSFFSQSADTPDDQGTGIQLPSTFCPDFHDRDAVLKLRFNYVGNTGMHFSSLGLDTSSWGERIKTEVDENKAIQAIHSALKLGINYIDTSPYDGEGKVESLVGKALASVPRKAYYIGAKVGRYSPNISKMFDFTAERVLQSVDESLARLRLSYVDILQIQDVQFAPNIEMILSETLPALERIHSAGKARFIGISGYPIHIFKDIVEKSGVPIDTIRSHCRYGLFNRDLKDIIPEMKENGVGIINAAPLGMGLLSSLGPTDKNHPAPESLRRAAKEAVTYAKSMGEDLGEIGLKYCYRVPGLATTLCNMERPEIVQACYSTCIQPMTEKQTGIMHEVVKKYFIPLGRTSWEMVEVTKYWEEMEKKGLSQPRTNLEEED